MANRFSLAMERTGQWVFSQEISTDIIVVVGEANFCLHKFMLVAKSNHIRKLILESKETDLTRINLSDIPGGPEIFEKAAKFCYGVNFEITVDNVAALRCAAEYLQMTDKYCDGNLAGRTDDFLSQVALTTLSGALVVLKSCEDLLPIAADLGIRIIASMKGRGAKGLTLASAIITYTERSLSDHSGKGARSLDSSDPDVRLQQRDILESIVALLPQEKSAFPIHFLCCLLRTAIFLRADSRCKSELEKKISIILEHVTLDDLLVLSFTVDGARLFDLESVRKVISGFVEREKGVAIFNAGEVCSTAMYRVGKTIDAYLGEIATYADLTISKFNGIANLVPKAARKADDDLYRAIDIYLKAHPNLDEIEREKVCSVMDPLKLSYDARVHASQNKRLPVQIVLHALYYDQLKLRSGGDDDHQDADAVTMRKQVQADTSLVKENEELRTELLKMKMYIQDIKKGQGTSSKSSGKKPTFFSSMSKTLGKLNPFKNGSKDTLNIDDGMPDLTKPRRRRFSIS
ncbi:hypothetical protein SASPL_135762 [Salvia splendens]|uniref:Root phototropism protein 2 n=1 Tax=Salvia splendens TaxID=180675 RepID=A0A8X8WYK1_SALSN|nr:hypothetical protein SASPL_135762 [Salvia splendens]